MFLVSVCRTGIVGSTVELRHLRYFVAVAEAENILRGTIRVSRSAQSDASDPRPEKAVSLGEEPPTQPSEGQRDQRTKHDNPHSRMHNHRSMCLDRRHALHGGRISDPNG